MPLQNPLLAAELRHMLAQGENTALKEFCEESHPGVVAELISALSRQEAWAVLRNVELPLRAEIFSHLPDDFQVQMIKSLGREEIVRMVSEMPHDERADLFRRMPEDQRETVLPALAQAEREDIRRLAAYEEGSAGAVMTSDYATLSPEMTAAQAIEHLREVAPDRETIYYAYVVDARRKLLGFVSLKDLIVARRNALVDEIMHREVLSVSVSEDQETAARQIQKYDLLALPVTDEDGALVGIITHDDALDIITQEQTEDMEKFMAISGSHEDTAYMKISVWTHFRNRFPWVVALAVLGLISGFIVQNFEGLLTRFTVLAAFMPMLADTGGNTGSQSATLVVRALALNEISPKDIFRILGREFQIALLLGVLLAVIAFGRVIFFGGGSTMPEAYSLVRIGLAIALALGLQVVTSTLVGALLPLGAASLKLDPAVVASPALTTVVDITGLIIYFTTAKLLLGI